MTFDQMRIDIRIKQMLHDMGITQPTPIQAKAIPVAESGADLIALAQTGTGKTLAFGLPAIAHLSGLPHGTTGMLVLAPTRELAQQVHDVIHPLAKAVGLTTACVYGGVGMEQQATALRRGASIVVACPGRLLDHMQRGNAKFDKLEILVLDEADRMLDMGFLPDIKRILSKLPRKRQTMMFSATFPYAIACLADTMMTKPQRIEAGAVSKPADAVRQGVYAVSKDGKTGLLKKILAQAEVGPTLVFMRTKRATDRLARILDRDGYDVAAIHGDIPQSKRQKAIEGFRSGRVNILIATDVAARGLDISGISHVINYDIPGTPEDYVHRIGRTARASATGDAYTFVTPDDGDALHDIEKAIGRPIERIQWEGAIQIDDPKRAAQRLVPKRATVLRAWG